MVGVFRKIGPSKICMSVLEAVKRFYGDNLYALRRVKDAANTLGWRERNELIISGRKSGGSVAKLMPRKK